MTTTIEMERTAPVAVTRLATHGLVAVIVASVVNVFIRFAAVDMFNVPTGFGPLGWGPVINTTVVAAIGATVVYGLLTRVSQRPDRAFLKVTIVVLVLSFVPLLVPPAFLAEAPMSVMGTLAVLHVSTAGIVVGLLLRTRRSGG